MKIELNQHKVSLSDSYNIIVDGVPQLSARTKLFRLFAEISLFDQRGVPAVIIKRQFNWLKAKFTISYNGEVHGNFRTEKLWKMHNKYFTGEDEYDLYGHKGTKVSVFKNDEQIGHFEKQRVTWFDGDNYNLIANDDCDKYLMCSFMLIWDNYYSGNSNVADSATVTYDFGNIGPEARKFNSNWRPKLNEKNSY